MAGWLPAEWDHFEQRVHFVTDAPGDVAGGLGDFLTANPGVDAFGIDRAQTWDNPGAYYDVTNSFVVSSPIYGYIGRYYNFRHAQALELARLLAQLTSRRGRCALGNCGTR